MLTMRQEQIDAFRQYHLQKFEGEMVEHSKVFSPRLCSVLGDQQLRVALRSAMSRAEGYELTNRGPIRLFIEIMFLWGSAFDTDPQYPAVGEALRASGDQMVRAEQIHQASLEYFERVSGPDAANTRDALTKLSTLVRKPMTFASDNFAASLLGEMDRIFPQKVAYVGVRGLRMLIDEGSAEAQRYRFSTVRQTALIVFLMFFFGHGCTRDPLYPWISRTLRDERIVNPTERAERLEKKAVTWLEHVLAENGEGYRV